MRYVVVYREGDIDRDSQTIPALAWGSLETLAEYAARGRCEDHLDPEGYCRICTALQDIDELRAELGY